jgi:hypothetical protein
MKTQVALRLDSDLVDLERTEGERENRSLANLVEHALADALISPPGDCTPVLSVVDADLDGIVAIDDDACLTPERLSACVTLLPSPTNARPSATHAAWYQLSRKIGTSVIEYAFVAPSDGRD